MDSCYDEIKTEAVHKDLKGKSFKSNFHGVYAGPFLVCNQWEVTAKEKFLSLYRNDTCVAQFKDKKNWENF